MQQRKPGQSHKGWKKSAAASKTKKTAIPKIGIHLVGDTDVKFNWIDFKAGDTVFIQPRDRRRKPVAHKITKVTSSRS